VHKVVEEGRSFVRRAAEKFDLIQLSLVDSWAASASGAFVMAENFLYTKEAFSTYYDHLTDAGILTVTRFHLPQSPQVLRITSLAAEVLAAKGVARPGDHLMVVILEGPKPEGTVLVSKRPFTPAQIARLRRETDRLRFFLAWAPDAAPPTEFARLLEAPDRAAYLAAEPFDLSAPTDDRPFFFHMASTPAGWRKLAELSVPDSPSDEGDEPRRGGPALAVDAYNVKWFGTFLLMAVLGIATVLAVVCILGPLYTLRRAELRDTPAGKGAALAYFACLGVGFMLVEIPLLQRFTFFLGHPVYALSVVLLALLVFAGFGSLLSTRLWERGAERALRTALLVLAGLLVVYNYLTPGLLERFITLSPGLRMALATLLLAPLGIVIGMPLPLGIRAVERAFPQLIPWVWGVNGVCSVFASLFALACAMTVGFTRTILIGQVVYLLALVLAWRLGAPLAGAKLGRRSSREPASATG
jgi:hypothetical protein